jgi:predicted Zn finger-like uncharacterized protein
MDIACPTCATTYEIDDATIGEAGRKVRCAECGTVWRTHRDGRRETLSAPPPPAEAPLEPPPTLEAPPLAPSEADVAAADDLPASGAALEPSGEAPPPEKPAKGRASFVQMGGKGRKPGGALLLGALKPAALATAGSLLLLAGAYVGREDVVRAAPQSAAVFAAIGAPVNLRGIELRNVRGRIIDDNGVNVLVIDGDLVNLRAEPSAVPRLRFAVLGDKGQELFVWTAQADRPSLRPGETLNFRRRLAAPPSDGRDVSVRFLSASDITAGLK